MKARVKADAVIFAAVITCGLIGLWLSKFPVDKTVWWIGFVVFAGWLIIEICFISPYNHAKSLVDKHGEEMNSAVAKHNELESRIQELKHELERKPLTGVRLRNECDKWVASGQELRERLVMDGQAAIPDAKKWIRELETFTELNLSVYDYDAVNSVTLEYAFNLYPNQEEKAYQHLVGHRYGRLSVICSGIK